jgi:HEAT repeat protein
MKKLLILIAIFVIACVGVVLLVPTFRLMLLGLVKGERFYHMRPTSYWIKALKDKDPAVRRNAAYALGPLPPQPDKDIPPLSGSEAEEAVPALIEALEDEDLVVRRYAIDALLSMGLDAKTAIPAIIEKMKDHDETVRANAAHALGYMKGVEHKVASAPLTEALKDKDPLVRARAARSLFRLGGEAKIVVPVLLEVLQNKNNASSTRREAAWSLGRIGPRAKNAIPALLQLLNDQDESVSGAAAEALKKIESHGIAKAEVANANRKATSAGAKRETEFPGGGS